MFATGISDQGHTYRVLITEDCEHQRVLLREILESKNCIVDETDCGECILDKLRAAHYDVLLLDRNLPGVSGESVCQDIRSEPEFELLPIIIITGDSSTQTLTRCLEAGASDFISKPFHPMELVARTLSAALRYRVVSKLDSTESMLFALARMVEAKDKNTGDHCSRLAYMSLVFGRYLGLSETELTCLYQGGVLHDIGKLGIPDHILLKRGPLSEPEWEIMRQHTSIGYELCRPLRSLAGTVPIVRSHHEKWNGSGYPQGLSGENIPKLARIFQLVDIFDALTMNRPYKKAWSQENALAELEREARCGWRDPELTEQFIRLIRDNSVAMTPPEKTVTDGGERIFQAILDTGALVTHSGPEPVPRAAKRASVS